ncbi:MAG: penicillin-binding transpeptidase domain-containing protein [Candidatus Omnitrophica bacterium]|nr:penicillin-binding transpeptidase domain-containing protein [Candidatus Omnitrophota bacterium]
MYIKEFSRRFYIVFLSFLVFFTFIIARLFFIQFFHGRYLSAIAEKQQSLYIELEPQRGIIYDSSARPLAINIAAQSLYAVPREIKDKEKIIAALAPILNADYSYLKDRLYRNKSFVWLARKITPQQTEKIKALKIKGLGFIRENKRAYPNGYLASHIVGFTDIDNHGLSGEELAYDKYLKGVSGWAFFLRDARQNRLDIAAQMVSPRDGLDIVLTIDEVIQYIAEKELDKAAKDYNAKGASLVVLDPYTGRVLALVNRPTFDLNYVSSTSSDVRRNRAICDLFEPGSVFKIVTASAALEENKVNENDKFFCENGSYRVANHILHDHQSHGWLTFREVIEQSSNIGTTKVAQILGPEVVYRYAKLFGFGSDTGIDLPGEIRGMLKEPRFWSKTSIGAVPIGQEVGVNVLQLATAIAAIANGGYLMKPFVVSAIQDKQQHVLRQYKPMAIRRVISVNTAERMKMILKGVVNDGTGKLGKPASFTAAGKTGTAQKLEPDGRYSHNKFVASFIGFALVDEPHPYYFGGVVAAPAFKNVAEEVIKYLKAKQLNANRLTGINEITRIN